MKRNPTYALLTIAVGCLSIMHQVEAAYWGSQWNADPDGDEVINLLDPDSDNDGIIDSEDVPTLVIDPALNITEVAITGEVITFVLKSSVGKSYQLRYSETLKSGDWQLLGDPVMGTGEFLVLEHTIGSTSSDKRFYDVLVADL